MLKTLTVFGTRQEVIKRSCVIKEINKHTKDSICHIETLCRQRKEQINQRAVVLL